MAYTWEGFPIVAPVTFRSNQTVWTVDKLDKSIDRTVHPAQRWELSFGIITDTKENLAFNALTTDFGSKNQMIMPSLNYAAAISTAKPSATQIKVSAGASAGVSTINIKNSSTLCGARIGTFIKFANHNKIYVLTGNTSIPDSDPSHPITFFPALKYAVDADVTVTFYDDVVLNYYYDDSMMQGITYRDGILTGIDRISIIEAI